MGLAGNLGPPRCMPSSDKDLLGNLGRIFANVNVNIYRGKVPSQKEDFIGLDN